MVVASLIQSVVRRPTAADLGLIIEQAPYPKGTGRVTRLAIVRALAARLYGLEQPEVDCGMDGVDCRTAVYVFPYDPDLNYTSGVTHGVPSPAVREEITVTEKVSFSLTAEATVKLPILVLVSVRWFGDEVWNAAGEVLRRSRLPALSVDGQTVRTPEPVYGTADVIYKAVRFVHAIAISPREDAVENVYQSVFWAAWNGGVKIKEIEPPEGAENNFEFKIECTGGANTEINPDDDDEDRPPTAPKADREIELNYCEDF